MSARYDIQPDVRQRLAAEVDRLRSTGLSNARIFAAFASQIRKNDAEAKLTHVVEFFELILDRPRADALFVAYMRDRHGKARCGKCNGRGGWSGWPGFTCFDCGGAGWVDV